MPALPLDELQVSETDPTTGKLHSFPALHPIRTAERFFVLYRTPPKANIPALVEEFLERAQFIAQDLDWLLALPHDKFWCQVIFDETLQKCLDSYVSLAPRRFDELVDSPPAVTRMQERLQRSVFLVFLRMSTHKESRDNFITPSVFGEILYNNFLFDIPKILDLCVLFGKGNTALLNKMIENIFMQQPSYYSDLEETVPTVLQVFNNILGECGLQEEGASCEPQRLEEKIRVTPSEMPLQELKDIVLYLCDTCTTLWAFLDVFPPASQIFQKHSFLSRLAAFYELMVPELESAIKKGKFEDRSLQMAMWRRLSHSRRKMMEISHIIINQTCLQPILERSNENIHTFVEAFLEIFTTLLQERRFIKDYDEMFPVDEDISLLQQASSAIDETRTAYILKGVESAWDGAVRHKTSVSKRIELRTSPDGAAAQLTSNGPQPPSYSLQDDDHCPGASAARPSSFLTGVELDSLVTQVKDLLPDLGEGFVLACLEEYNCNVEQVINNLLEDRLSPALQKLDRDMPRQVKSEPSSLLASRANVFQDDEFDVFSRDSIDTSRVWKGRRRAEDSKQFLNDRSVVAEQRERYQQYSVIVEEVPIEEGTGQMFKDDYEDEYDDTYDGNQVGANDADSDDELISRRPFTIPQVLRTRGQVEQDDRQEDEEDEPEEEGVKPDNFVQDPALLRERAEARRMTFLARKGFRHDSSSAVVGTSRGQGQSKDTVQERRKKEANKSARGNHNRRSMADRKRNKGMIPS
ncbi:activating signal cointegrator 1 complex subunit 2 isoform X2 [Ambystoma mexicanum]|uniref:activating signal cointegrator 1 complex subunit 2 isoform X2 n=1 Tax=Ambystoma mexicanum TaxID=8296 RepID=UPI0037E84A1A